MLQTRSICRPILQSWQSQTTPITVGQSVTLETLEPLTEQKSKNATVSVSSTLENYLPTCGTERSGFAPTGSHTTWQPSVTNAEAAAQDRMLARRDHSPSARRGPSLWSESLQADIFALLSREEVAQIRPDIASGIVYAT